MKNVTLVDDSTVIHIQVEIIFKELIESGLITFKAYDNPAEFVDDLNSGATKFDLLIVDINMPQMNGLEVASSVKQHPTHSKKPILIMTTETDDGLIAKAKEIGVTGWIVKPPKSNKLIKATKMALQI